MLTGQAVRLAGLAKDAMQEAIHELVAKGFSAKGAASSGLALHAKRATRCCTGQTDLTSKAGLGFCPRVDWDISYPFGNLSPVWA